MPRMPTAERVIATLRACEAELRQAGLRSLLLVWLRKALTDRNGRAATYWTPRYLGKDFRHLP
jgi:hypothetical protein